MNADDRPWFSGIFLKVVDAIVEALKVSDN
jgi:hypothetical protein